MQKLNTIYDDISFTITDKLAHLPQFIRDQINENCRMLALDVINNWKFYTNGTKEENEQNQGLCLLVQITNFLTSYDNKFLGILEIFHYLDHDLTDTIDKAKAKEVIENVFNNNYPKIWEEIL